MSVGWHRSLKSPSLSHFVHSFVHSIKTSFQILSFPPAIDIQYISAVRADDRTSEGGALGPSLGPGDRALALLRCDPVIPFAILPSLLSSIHLI
jgi:hypothetical protein